LVREISIAYFLIGNGLINP